MNKNETTVDALCTFFHQAIKADRSVATGDDGFEGLVAILLRELTGQGFHVAGSGLQQYGDALDYTAGISLQSKAYFGEKQPTVVSILGDFMSQLHSNEKLEVLVVAMRELTAEKLATLETVIGQHGLEVICIQCTGAHPELLMLLGCYWNQVAGHPLIQRMPEDLREVIEKIRADDNTHANGVIKDLQSRILHNATTHTTCISKSQTYLRQRFGLENDRKKTSGLYPIRLATAITRDDSAIGFRKWWDGEKPLLFTEGEEGSGKSWILAQEAWRIAESGEALVLWLDSFHWQGTSSFQEVVEAAFRVCLGVPDSGKDVCSRLFRKLESRWDRPTLLILDGMNERMCQKAAVKILRSLSGRSPESWFEENPAHSNVGTVWRQPEVLRLVFTLRSMQSTPGIPLSLIEDYATKFRILPYSDQEFVIALSREKLRREELPRDAVELLHYPRYFSVFLRVRSRIPSTATITKAVIWWYDLVDKIESRTDMAIREALKLESATDAEELLTSIAQNLGTNNSLSIDQLNSLFGGKYLEIRSQLRDSRLFKESGRGSATVSDDHVSLAWGLVILKVLEVAGNTDVTALADRIHALLEPGLSDPRRALGILVALQLSLGGNGELSDTAVAAGLLAWFCSHNIDARGEQLEFWCGHRLTAYRLFIENLLISTRAGSSEKEAVAPLARLWRNDPDRRDELATILRQWLVATWCEEWTGTEEGHEWNGIYLYKVPQEAQLRLTPIAISILSQRPEDDLLTALAECSASAGQSKLVHDGKPYPAKWPQKSLQPLMRWCYTETVQSSLRSLKDRETRPTVKKALQWLIEGGLGLEFSKQDRRPGPATVEEAIRDNQDPRTYGKPDALNWLIGMKFLAVRDDLPEICEEAKREILHQFSIFWNPDDGNFDQWRFEELWPWALRLDPGVFEKACVEPLVKALTGKAGPVLEVIRHFQDYLWKTGVTTIAEAVTGCSHKQRENPLLFTAEFLFQWVLFHGSQEQIEQHLCIMENLRGSRGHLLVKTMGFTELLRILKPEHVINLSRERAKALCDEPQWQSDPDAVARMEYWLTLWANTSSEHQADAAWAVDILSGQCPASCRNDCLRLLARSGASRLTYLIFNDPVLSSRLEDADYEYMLRIGNLPGETYKEVQILRAESRGERLAPRGSLLLLCGDDDGFKAWGHELLQLACSCATEHGGSPGPVTRFEVDSHGRIVASGPAHSNGVLTMVCLDANTWGRDEGRQPESVDDPVAEWEAWRVEEDSLSKWVGFVLRDFNDEHALLAWADRYPTEFITYVDAFFATVLTSPPTATKLGGFPHFLLAVTLQHFPLKAYALWEKLKPITSSHVHAYWGVDWVPASAWRPRKDQFTAVDEIRKATLFQMKNDEQIMGLACYAAMAGEGTELLALCRDLVASPLSKERALAVSALAWIWEDCAGELLVELSETDPSSWVRGHATWALGVRSQDSACRRAYRRALKEPDEYVVSRELQIMKPALLPSNIVWRKLEEQDVLLNESDFTPGKRAIIRLFWYHWDCANSSLNDTKVLGRRMKEFVRGHRVDKRVEEQMAPWWCP